MSAPRIAFRTDASLDIGAGHVFRCLTLADALLERGGARSVFICRTHEGNLIDLICKRGYDVVTLPPARNAMQITSVTADDPAHAAWLGTDWQTDYRDTANALGDAPVDWLIVDHYGLDARWERKLRSTCRRLMVIDDLADRPHDCDLLLDQNLGRSAAEYAGLVAGGGTLLIGPQYALLRPEFAALRPQSLARRKAPQVKRLLITMGGVDRDNATCAVLDALMECQLPVDCQITVVMGLHAPWLEAVRQTARLLPWSAEVLVNVGNMAQLMVDADLSIGAAGGTSWERSCLGLPAIMLVQAENQRLIARGLERLGAALVIDLEQKLADRLPRLIEPLITCRATRLAMSQAAASAVDGSGVDRVLALLEC